MVVRMALRQLADPPRLPKGDYDVHTRGYVHWDVHLMRRLVDKHMETI